MHAGIHSAFSVSFILVRDAVDAKPFLATLCRRREYTFGWDHHGHCTQTHLYMLIPMRTF